jgi:5'-nucleotidase
LRILLTNDDGVRAPGLAALRDIAAELSDDVWVVAPDDNQSAVGRSISLHEPITRSRLEDRVWAIRGTPSDCVVIALKHIMSDHPPDLVLSGVNSGQNLAEDLTFSGTVAGALMGTQMGVPSVALSLAKGFQGARSLPWDTARDCGAEVVRDLTKAGWPRSVTLNVNIPDVPVGQVRGVQMTRQGRRDHRMVGLDSRAHPRGGDYHWILYGADKSEPDAGTDLRAIYDGYVSVTPIMTDLTCASTLASLKGDG